MSKKISLFVYLAVVCGAEEREGSHGAARTPMRRGATTDCSEAGVEARG